MNLLKLTMETLEKPHELKSKVPLCSGHPPSEFDAALDGDVAIGPVFLKELRLRGGGGV